MRHPAFWIALLALGTAQATAADAWRPLWNGRDLASWTTGLAKSRTSAVLHDAPRDAKGNFSQPIGPNRDPLGVFSVVNTDGQPAIRISGQVFGEPRSTAAFTDYRLRLQFKWGEKKGPPRETAETPRDSGLLYHVHAEPGAEGRTWARSIEIQI